MTHHVSIDIETYSSVDLKKAGLYKYAQSPDFEVLLIAWVKDDRQTVRCLDLTAPNPDDMDELLSELYNPDNILHAYNAAFEHYCLNTWLHKQLKQYNGHPLATIPLSHWRCTMAHGLYCGYAAGLAATGEAMGLPQDKRKLGIGAALIRKFCVPQKGGRRVLPTDEPEKWELFKTYCRQDVVTEREIERRLRRWPMPEREQRLWALTCEANIIGVGVDSDLVDAALSVGAQEQEALIEEAKNLSGLDNPKSVQQLLKWLGDEMDTDDITDLRKTTVAELLKAGVDSPKAARMLELRQLMSKTSTKKYDALEAAMCADGRVRGMMFYYGANRTGRWAGRIVQPQNLPQNHLDSLDFARERVKARDTEMIKVCWGSVPDTLSQLIRTAFVPAPGKIYAIADYSAIEARVVAWLAGETWVLDAFRAGQDIYCATASQMFGVPVEKHGQNAHLRQRGKVATLALSYGGGEGALINMGALRMGIPEEDLPDIKARWRQANPSICRLWRVCEDAALRAMRTGKRQIVRIKERDPERARENEERMRANPGSYSEYFKTGVQITFGLEADPDTQQDFLVIGLPAGRELYYAHPYLAPAKNFPDRDSLHYYSVNQTSKKWAPTDTWGGKIVENITQAIARDGLAETILRLQEKGLTAVFHVHDEVIVEVDQEAQLDEVLAIMAEPLDWAPGLPLKGAGFCASYYQKD